MLCTRTDCRWHLYHGSEAREAECPLYRPGCNSERCIKHEGCGWYCRVCNRTLQEQAGQRTLFGEPER